MLPVFSTGFSLCFSVQKARCKRFYSIQTNESISSKQQEEWLKQKKVAKGYWKVKENQLQYMNWLSQKLNINTMEDLYKVSREDLLHNYGGSLIKNFNNSPIKLIKSVYPNYNWLPWKFNQTPKGYWNDENNIKQYMNWLSEKLNIKTMEDWYKVSYEDIIHNHGRTLIQSNSNSHINLIKSAFPNYNWLPWKFNSIPKGYWNDENNVKQYMNWLSDKLNIKTMEDWYNVSFEDFILNHGNALIKYYNNSPIKLITSIFSNYNWLPWKFIQAPKGYWNDENNIREYMNWLSDKLNIKTMEDWYKVTQKDIIQNYGSTLFRYTKNSNKYTKIQNILQTIYPEYKWDVYKFSQVPNGYITYLLENSTEQKQFVNYLEKKFEIKQTSDWYGITNEKLNQVVRIDVETAMKIVKQFYPEIDEKYFKF